MADRGRRLDEATRRMIIRSAGTLSIREASREFRVARNTVRKYRRKNLPSALEV